MAEKDVSKIKGHRFKYRFTDASGNTGTRSGLFARRRAVDAANASLPTRLIKKAISKII